MKWILLKVFLTLISLGILTVFGCLMIVYPYKTFDILLYITLSLIGVFIAGLAFMAIYYCFDYLIDVVIRKVKTPEEYDADIAREVKEL